MERKTIARITINGIMAGLYCVLILVNPLSFSIVNIRIADFIPVIVIIDDRMRWGVTLGMVSANFFSPFGLIDVIVALAFYLNSLCLTRSIKNKNIRLLLLAIITSVYVSVETSTLSHTPFIFELMMLLATQIPMCFIGAAIFNKIERYFTNV